MPPIHLFPRIPRELTRCSGALIFWFLTPASFAGGGLLDLATIDWLVRLPDLYVAALGDGAVEQERGLPQGGLQIERIERRCGVPGNDDPIPAQGGARGGVMDADVGHRAANNEGIDAPEAQEVIEVGPVESIVADLTDHVLILARRELIDDLPSPRALLDVVGPDVPLGVSHGVGVLGKDDLHTRRAGELEKVPDGRDRALRIRDDEGAALLHEIVLHVHDHERRLRRVHQDLAVNLVLGNLHHACHMNLLCTWCLHAVYRLLTVLDRAQRKLVDGCHVSLLELGHLPRRNTGSTSPITRAERIMSAPRIWTATSLSPASQ